MKFLFSSPDLGGVKRLVVVLWLSLAWTAPAAQVKLDSLRTRSLIYSNVTVLGFNTTEVFFTHAAGMTNVKLKYLDSTLQGRCLYDPNAAAHAEQQQAADEALYNESLASNMVAKAQQAALAAQRAAATSQDS